jgi:[lysine-biosynthesis-protein LysW]--L-2-aminoadipate ligase
VTTSTVVAELVAVLASRVRAEEKALLGALEGRGLPVEHVDPRRFSQAAGVAGPRWPVALNREISGTRARYAAGALEAAGTEVLNSAAATETCGDKWATSVALCLAGVATPRTHLALTTEAAAECIAELGYPVVVKPLSSSWGRRVALLRDADAAEAVLEHCAALPSPQAHIIYIQQFVDKPARDIRVVVVGGKPVAAAYRRSEHWRTNVARGASTEACPLDDDLARTAVAAAAAVGAEIAGVDIVEDRDGTPYVLEVNSGVEFAGLEAAHGGRAGVASAIADLVAARYHTAMREVVR